MAYDENERGIKRKMLPRVLVTISIMMLAIGSVILCKQTLVKHIIPEYSDSQRPVKSFVFVQRTSELEFITCVPIKEEGVKNCDILQQTPGLIKEVASFFNQIFS